MKKLLLLILLILPSAAQSQFLWDIAHTDFDGRYYYSFDAISCSGNICTASGSLIDNTGQRITMNFWRSIDGGLNWKMQDAGIPAYSNLRNISYFTTIQQIDPLNAVAGGLVHIVDSLNFDGDADSSLILRTFNGGVLWQRQNLHIAGIVKDIHFFDSSVGILNLQENWVTNFGTFAGLGRERFFTTTDGGRHWDSTAINFNPKISEKFPVFCSGPNSFAVFSPPHGPIFSSSDNWKTIDTSSVLISTSKDSTNRFSFEGCNFTGGNTILAYGEDKEYDTTRAFPERGRACLIRSIDGGKSWGNPQVFTDSLWDIQYMTQLDRDTILANGTSKNKILMSTDKGKTWRVDSLIIFDSTYTALVSEGMTFSSNGPVAIYSIDYGNRVPSVIIKGQYTKSRVNFSGMLNYNQRIFPNPATTTLNIVSVETSTPFKIIDILGRTVISGLVPDHNTITLDISNLARGVYYVLVERADIKGVYVIVGKLAVVGR